MRCDLWLPRLVGLTVPVARNHHALSRAYSASSFQRRSVEPPSRFVLSCTSASRSRPSYRRLAAMATAAAPSQTASEKEEVEFWERVTIHQKVAARLTTIEESRTLVDKSLSAFLSTISQRYEGFPHVSFLDIAADEDGSLIIAVSSLAPHRKDLEKAPKCCLLIMKDKLDRSDVLVTYIGEAVEVSEPEQKRVRDVFLSKHPEAFWVDFGDFKFLRIEPKHVRYATGIVTPFNATGEFSGDAFRSAKVDPIAQFSAPIAAHMNKDHAEETQLMVERALDVKVDRAKIIDLDRLGLNIQIGFQGKPIKLRIPFPRPAEDRKDVKTLIVQMVEGSK